MSDSRVSPKRAACDRCRTQKLRCIRVSDHPADACNRCVRSHTDCISSSSKRPGRPRNSTSASRQSGESTPSSSNSSTIDRNGLNTAVDLQTAENVDWFGLDLLNSWTTMESIFPDDGTSITDPAPIQNQAISCNDIPLHGIFTETTQEMPFPIQTEHQNPAFPQAFRRAPADSNLDPGVQLAVLQCELSLQVFALRSMTWDATKVLRITSMAYSGTTNPDQDTEYNPLAKIARTTEDFAKYLRSLQDAAGEKDRDGSSGLLQSSLSIPDVLTVLSCHLITLSIYDSIFSHFIEQAAQNPALATEILQSTPQLFVGGIAVPPRLDMLGHLLYCLVGGLLQPIETLLGLPDGFRVSLQRDRGGDDAECGLFSGESGRQLFATLLQIDEQKTRQGGGGAGLIASLKEKIRHVQGLG